MQVSVTPNGVGDASQRPPSRSYADKSAAPTIGSCLMALDAVDVVHHYGVAGISARFVQRLLSVEIFVGEIDFRFGAAPKRARSQFLFVLIAGLS